MADTPPVPTDAQERAATSAEPSAAWTLDQLIDELNFVICERRADVARIERERKETPAIKALRIRVVRDMESRVTAARDLLRDLQTESV